MSGNRPCQGRPEIFENPEELTGFPPETSPHGDLPGADSERPLSLAWITDDLLAHTRDVWSRHLGRDVSEDEAIDMLLNVKRLAETLLNVTRAEGGADERGDMGTGIVP
jgi:hypothetical protein